MNALKTILKMAFGLLSGVLLGLVGAALIICLTTGQSLGEYIGKFGKIGSLEMVAVVGVAVLAAVVGFFLAVIAHEAGHLVGGLLTGYRLVSFRIFNYTLLKIDGKWRIKRFAVAGTGGQCILTPPDLPVERIPTAWYNLGGILANLLLLLIALWLLFAASNPFWKEALWVFILVDAVLLFLNGVPMCINTVGNDAYNQGLLGKDLDSKRALVAQLRANALIQEGVRPKDLPADLFLLTEGRAPGDLSETSAYGELSEASAPGELSEADYRNNLKVYMPMAYATKLMDEGDFEGARRIFEGLYKHRLVIMPLYVKEIECELLYLRLLEGDKEGASQLLTKELRQYLETYRTVMSSKERTLCAVALLLDGDRQKAEKLYCDLEARRDSYLLQGEIASDLALLKSLLTAS